MGPLVALIPSLLPLIGEVLGKVIPDKAEAEKASLALQEELVKAANANMLAQTEINKVEASHSSTFVAGWRPFIGWVCGGAIALYYGLQILVGMMLWIWACYQAGVMVERPELGIAEIIGLTSVLLGAASLRTFEKVKGVAR